MHKFYPIIIGTRQSAHAVGRMLIRHGVPADKFLVVNNEKAVLAALSKSEQQIIFLDTNSRSGLKDWTDICMEMTRAFPNARATMFGTESTITDLVGSMNPYFKEETALIA